MLRMFGLSSQKHIRGTNIADLISPFQRSKATQCLKQVIEDGSVKDVQFTFVPSEGSSFPAEVSAALLRDHKGAPSSIICMTKDISERKHFDDERKRFSNYLERRVAERTAELENALSELESFSYSMSHDLRTPLRSIDGFAQAIIDEYGADLDEQGKDYVDRIRKASQTMATTIDNLIDLSRVTRRSRVNQEVDLSRCARSILTELEDGGKGRVVRTTVMDTPMVFGDQNLLTIAMRHLIENAWKFTDRNPYAKIEFGHEYLEGERVFYIRDNGVGFDMVHVSKLFQPFQRLHPTGDFPGQGVGLAMVKRIVPSPLW
jgi:PAS domain S-box-containing protein